MRDERLVPLFLIHFVHKNAGRGSLVSRARKRARNIVPPFKSLRKARRRFPHRARTKMAHLTACSFLYSCAMRDLNSRPSRCKRAALPTELIAHVYHYVWNVVGLFLGCVAKRDTILLNFQKKTIAAGPSRVGLYVVATSVV